MRNRPVLSTCWWHHWHSGSLVQSSVQFQELVAKRKTKMDQETQDEVTESFTSEQQEWIAALVARQIAAASESNNTSPPSTTGTGPGTSVNPPTTPPNVSTPVSGGSVGESGISMHLCICFSLHARTHAKKRSGDQHVSYAPRARTAHIASSRQPAAP